MGFHLKESIIFPLNTVAACYSGKKYLLPQQQLRIVNQAYTVKWTKYFIANS